MEEPSMEEPPMEEPCMEEPPMEEPSMEEHSIEVPTIEEPPIKEQRIDGDEVDANTTEEKIDEDAKRKKEEQVQEEKAAKLTVRLKGIPFEEMTEADIASLFPECEIEDEGIFIAPLTRVAYVEFKNEASVKSAIVDAQSLQCLGITLTQAKPFHRTKDIAVAAVATHLSNAPFSTDSFVIHLRFLPYWTTEDRVIDFYKDFEVLAIHMIWDHIGRTGSQCYVEFNSEEDQTKALQVKGLGRHVIFAKSDHTKLSKMFEIVNHDVDNFTLVIRLSNLDQNICEEDIRIFFIGIDIIGVYLAKDWLNQGTGTGFVTVPNYEQAFKVWTKSKHRINIVGNKKITVRESKIVELYASCVTELTSTLISCYTREKNSFNRGYGQGRGGYGAGYRYDGSYRRGRRKKEGRRKNRNIKNKKTVSQKINNNLAK